MKTKTCIYCNKEFTDMDFPRTFHRMVTCGSNSCTGERRRELWRKKHKKR